MPTPSKPVALLEGHLTKQQIAERKKAEAAYLTGTPMREWDNVKNDPYAHRCFLRLKKLFRTIGHDDALMEASINRYCVLLSECDQDELALTLMRARLLDLERARDGGMEDEVYFKLLADMNGQITYTGTLLMKRRAQLLAIEKDSGMTLKAQLQSIPKPDGRKEDKASKFAAFGAGNGGKKLG